MAFAGCMKTSQRVFLAVGIILLALLTGLVGYSLATSDDEDTALAEQLRVLGYCPAGETLTSDEADAAGNSAEDSAGDVLSLIHI